MRSASMMIFFGGKRKIISDEAIDRDGIEHWSRVKCMRTDACRTPNFAVGSYRCMINAGLFLTP